MRAITCVRCFVTAMVLVTATVPATAQWDHLRELDRKRLEQEAEREKERAEDERQHQAREAAGQTSEATYRALFQARVAEFDEFLRRAVNEFRRQGFTSTARPPGGGEQLQQVWAIWSGHDRFASIARGGPETIIVGGFAAESVLRVTQATSITLRFYAAPLADVARRESAIRGATTTIRLQENDPPAATERCQGCLLERRQSHDVWIMIATHEARQVPGQPARCVGVTEPLYRSTPLDRPLDLDAMWSALAKRLEQICG